MLLFCEKYRFIIDYTIRYNIERMGIGYAFSLYAHRLVSVRTHYFDFIHPDVVIKNVYLMKFCTLLRSHLGNRGKVTSF